MQISFTPSAVKYLHQRTFLNVPPRVKSAEDDLPERPSRYPHAERLGSLALL